MRRVISRYLNGILITVFSFIQMMGYYLDNYGSVFPINKYYAIKQIILSAGLAALLMGLWKLIRWLAFERRNQSKWAEGNKTYSTKRVVIVTWSAIVISWLTVLMAYYPGVFAYDASNQTMQVINRSYSTHHPLVHTLILGRLFCLGHELGDNNWGVFIYCILQIVVLASACTYLLTYLYKYGISKLRYIVCLTWYMFFSVHSILAISTTKDVYFAACCTIYLVSVLIILNFRLTKGMKIVIWLLVGISTCGMVLFRNNAIYAIVCAIVPVYVFIKQERKSIISGMVLGVIIAIVIDNMLAFSLNAEKGSKAEMLSVPLQQMARVERTYGQRIDRSLREELCFFLPEDILDNYADHISDGIKNNVDITKITQNKFRFLKTYIKLGIHYPREYIDAFAALTQGYWYLGDKSHSEIYGVGTEYRLGYLLTNYKDMPNSFEVVHETKFQGLEKILEILFSNNEYQRIPIIWMIFSPAFYGWLLLICLYRLIHHKKYIIVGAICPVLFYHASLLLGPTCLIRYVYPTVVCIPIIIYEAFREQKVKG